MSLEISAPIRTALIELAGVGDVLDQYAGEPAVFTRRPTPADAPLFIALVNPNTFLIDADGLTSKRPIVGRDIAIYGPQPDKYWPVTDMATLIYRHFHRVRPHRRAGR